MSDFPESWNDLKVQLAHDWLTGMRGGERVLELLCQGFPAADVHTLLYKPGALTDHIESHRIETSWLQRVPNIHEHYRYFLPFFPSAVKSLKPAAADLVISTSHCVAKGIRPPEGAKHLCYCFTPMRYAWTFYEEYFGANPVKRAVLGPTLAGLRRWDRSVSDRVDRFVAISEHVRKRIKTFYDRDADLVYPPVDTHRCTPGEGGEGDYDLVVSALVPYKKIDLAVEAWNRLGRPLKIVGTGTEFEALRRKAKSNIEFPGWLSDDEIVSLYRGCRCLVFPGEEDFGIVPVEVQACGRPVLAYAKGGALETIKAGVSGVFFQEQTVASMLEGLEELAATSWDSAAIRRHAEGFSVEVFLQSLDQSIQACLGRNG